MRFPIPLAVFCLACNASADVLTATYDAAGLTALPTGDIEEIRLGTSGLYAFGANLTAINGTARPMFARLSGNTWQSSACPAFGANDVIAENFEVVGDTLYIGGSGVLVQKGNTAARCVSNAWSLLGGEVRNEFSNDIVRNGTNVIVAGYVSGGTTIQQYNSVTNTLSNVPDGILVGYSEQIAGSNTALYVQGESSGTKRLLKIVGTTVTSADITAVAPVVLEGVSDGSVLIGGTYTSLLGTTANNIGRWDGTNVSTLGTGSNQGVNGVVSAIAVAGNRIFVAGNFTQAGTQTVSNIAMFENGVWYALGAGLNGPVFQLEVSSNGTTVYALGNFTASGATPLFGLARIAIGAAPLNLIFANGFEN
jgi:trimeric autotransporter adhesin